MALKKKNEILPKICSCFAFKKGVVSLLIHTRKKKEREDDDEAPISSIL